MMEMNPGFVAAGLTIILAVSAYIAVTLTKLPQGKRHKGRRKRRR